jgi:hypothetical protein
MNACEIPSTSSRRFRHLAHAAVFILAVLIAWALWRGYGGLLSGDHVH